MVSLQFYNFTHFADLNYTLDEVQIQFTAEVPNALQRIEQRSLKGDRNARPVTIFSDDVPAGFFVLDFGSDKIELTDNPNAVLLRSLSINPEFQGNGIGKIAMKLLPDFVKKYFPETTEIVLAVNENNASACNLYKLCGYIFTDKTRAGRSGTQLLMQKYI